MDPSEKLLTALSEDTGVISACSNLTLVFNGYAVPDRFFSDSFDDFSLSNELKATIYSLFIEKPSAVQSSCFFLIQKDQHVVYQAPAGTGKTLGFVVSTLNKIKDFKSFQIAVLTPTKELSQQISEVYSLFLAKLGGSCLNVCSSVNSSSEKILNSRTSNNTQQQREGNRNDPKIESSDCQDDKMDYSKQPPCVVVGTPAAVLREHSRKSFDLAQCKMLVIDEADHTVSTFFSEILRIFKFLPNTQKIFFSASFSPAAVECIKKLLGQDVQKTDFLLGVPKTTEEVMFFNIHCEKKDKTKVIKDLLTLLNASQIIVFCKQKNTVDILEKELRSENFPVTKIHGGLQHVDRENAVAAFKKIESKILVATDLFGRGMDIPLVNLVINFDLPIVYETQEPDFECYQHRVGRTARFGRKGFVIDFVCNEKDFDVCARICKNFEITQETIDIESLEKAFMKSAL